MKGSMKFLAGVISVVAFATLAHAETVTATLTSLTPWEFPTVQLTYNAGADHVQITGGAGQIGWSNGSSDTNDPLFSGSFSTYCIDLLQDINFNHAPYVYDVKNLAYGAPQQGAYLNHTFVSPMGVDRANDIQKLYDLHFADTLGTGTTADFDKTAFQLAIWNLIYDESGSGSAPDASVSLNSGNFYVVSGVDPTAITTANTWLAQVLNSSVQDVHTYTVEALVGENGAQDQVFAAPGTTPPPPFESAPLPQPIFGGLALLSLCFAARWKTPRRAIASI